MLKIYSRSEKETFEFARILGKKITSGQVLGLVGDLGSGKTTFLKGLARGLNLKARVTSPSFVIMSRHPIPGRNKRFFYHFDLYRLKHLSDLYELGFWEVLRNPQNITAVEWADRARKYLPKHTIMIKFAHGRLSNERLIKIYAR